MEEKKQKIMLVGNPTASELAKYLEENNLQGCDIEIIDPSKVADFERPLHSMPITPEPFMYENIYRDLENEWNKIPKSDRWGTVAKVRNSKEDPKIQRNDPCPCGSGKKYKKCCGNIS